ncbi:ABC transporter ATP-binding protein [Qipengyuania atrilutea]|uniref:ABC transporter ATP-binding protein n=1 Tax=Qipengyuania atrilutea TaxID=2744473 RepID=A0A850H0B9_9SPHN|nr:ABC transporter ATP-binding protein [Actirhodobacter atriluteus]NVD45331.1 ABC transporter ATP-binding protein [Actirhodobacter atriluteus]
MDSAIETSALTKRYGHDRALTDVDFSVPEGAVCLLAGTNGAGKTTLLRILINLERRTTGACEVLGLDPACNGAAVRAQVGFVSETTDWGYGWLRVGEMLAHVASYYPSWDPQYALELAQILAVRMDRRMKALSKGQRRCVQIVTALAHRPQLLLLDEPTDGLDPLVRDRTLRLFTEHTADTGCTAVVSTHLVSEVAQLADHVAILRSGAMLHQGPVERMLGELHRLELDAPSGWSAPSELQTAVLRQDHAIGRSPTLLVTGQLASIQPLITKSGAAIRHAGRLDLSEAVVARLQSEPKS